MHITRSLFSLALAGALSFVPACSHQGPARTAKAPEPAASAPPARPNVGTEELDYKSGETKLEGFLAYPEGTTDKRPGVLVVHEWWGLNDYARTRARMLAELGYVALAVDMYGNGRSTEHPDDARKLTSELMKDRSEAVRRFEAAGEALRKHPRVDATKIAAIGYCFGGAIVLMMARSGADLDAVASFHGNYATETPMKPNAFAGKIFVAHGADDTFTTPEQVSALKAELDAAHADYKFVAYDGAKHGFSNPEATAAGKRAGLSIAYDQKADAASWQTLQDTLRAAFREP
jgi:dienelactone hydrolase